MATQKRRMALTLPEDVEQAVFALALEVDKPASKVVTELLQEMVPHLESLTKIARATKSGNKVAAKRALAHMVGDSLADLLSQQQTDMFPAAKARSKK